MTGRVEDRVEDLHAAGVVHSIVVLRWYLMLAIAACGNGGSAGDDAQNVPKDAPGPQPDAALAYSNTFRFAVVGDTRPANEDDLNGYPTPIITGIWKDVQGLSPATDFAISTGDYMFAG